MDNNSTNGTHATLQPPQIGEQQQQQQHFLQPEGKIIAIVGPMFSCKTMDLIQLVTKYKRLGRRVLIIRHGLDKRFDDTERIRTHDGYTIAVNVHQIYKTELRNDDIIQLTAKSFDVIAVDEGQWFDEKELLHFARRLRTYKKIVIVAGLMTDKDLRIFPSMLPIMAHANEIRHHKAGCKECGSEEAIYTREIASSNVPTSTTTTPTPGTILLSLLLILFFFL